MKTRYRKPEAVKELERLANQAARDKYPGTPPHLLAPRKYRDDTANSLTKCIIDYIRFNGGSAYRINSQGQWDVRLKKWRYAGGRRGLPDVIGTINGASLNIEVKIGKDKLSIHQEKIKNEINQSGGLYFIATNFSDFKTWFDEIKKTGEQPR